MTDLGGVPTADLEAELASRSDRREPPAEPCSGCRGKWQTYVGIYDSDGYTRRCHGCRRAVARCTCW